ncbi:FtsX-like permease family protein [Janthinobacterium sp. FT14W]|uniref:ABC transporter permease n=1 Tax=Janthinobacterium sp. FT14W TaxID=2654253 RepID=UPI0012651C6E|nr:ABC transporter permease [Janthinobacterium sp. FT14W]KAB8061271.1 FtsX-like permease family protein [Janthinobacterium sp. FT14W]
MLTNFWFDLKYAYRLWTKSPGYFLVCMTVVALSVGLALWASVLAYTMTMKPLPFAGSNQWLSIQMARNATAGSAPSIDQFTYQEIVKRTRTVDHLGAYTSQTAMLSNGHSTMRLRAAAISPRLFAAMGILPTAGRMFEVGDGQREAAPTAILSYPTWKTYFASDPAIVGKQARIDGRSVQVIGIMPEDFFAFEDFEVWFPLRLEPVAASETAAAPLAAFAMLGNGQQAETLLAEMKPAVDEVNLNYAKKFDSGRRIELVPASRMNTHGMAPVVAMISMIAVAVLLLGCVNIGLVFFARLLERSRELALRMALGSSRWRILRQCLLESSLVMIPGLILGVVLTTLGVRWTASVSNVATQYLANGREANPLILRPMDLLIAVVIAAVLWLLSTLIPSWRIAKQDASVSLGGSGKGSAKAGTTKMASAIVGFQVMLSALILVVCVNLMMAVKDETSKPTGINSSNVMLSTYPTVFSERYADVNARVQYWSSLSASVQKRLPGTEVAYMAAVPTRAPAQAVAIEGRERTAGQGALKLPLTAVSDNYFGLLGIQLRTGRLFDNSDIEESLNTAIVDEVTANRHWPGQNAIGKRIQLNPEENGPWLTVVGVVSSVGHEPYGDEPGAVYRPIRQANPGSFMAMVKLPDSALQNAAALQEAAFSTDQDLALHNLQYIDPYLFALDISFSSIVKAFGAIAVITMILAASGLFGLISRFVAGRTQEIGIRRALGSTPARIGWLFFRQGGNYLLVAVVGGALGLLIANVLSNAIPNILSNAALVTPGVFLLLAAVIFIATYLPTRRAMALEPADALRYE